MKSVHFLALIFALTSGIAQARNYEASFEDTKEFLQISPSAGQETWAYVFELINPDSSTTVLSSDKTFVLQKPASTMKLFTGWWAFQEKTRTDTYLSKMLRESNNDMAESTAQDLGGVNTMTDYYNSNGLELNDSNFIAYDGSGLSYNNRANCDVEIKLLKLIKASPEYPRFKNLLAQPGYKNTRLSSTLDDRLKEFKGKLFAKTGTLNKTASLSGFIETKRGTMVFCILSDNLRVSLDYARKKMDNMIRVNFRLVK